MLLSESVQESEALRSWVITASSRPNSTYLVPNATTKEALLIGLNFRSQGVEDFITVMEMVEPLEEL